MIAAPHQQKLKLDRLPSRLAGRGESVVDGVLAGAPSAVNYPNVLNALNILPVGHAVPSLPVVDDQSTTAGFQGVGKLSRGLGKVLQGQSNLNA